MNEGIHPTTGIATSGFSEIHCHLDKTLTIKAVGNASGTLMEAIHNWVAYKPQISRADYVQRGAMALEMALAAGTTRLRSHVDVDSSGFLALEAMLELREQYQTRLPIQIVALGAPGEQPELMREALRLGADVVGGCPAIRPDGKLEIRNALALASEFGRPVDLHILRSLGRYSVGAGFCAAGGGWPLLQPGFYARRNRCAGDR
jgi:cytosine/creatinine deaminase